MQSSAVTQTSVTGLKKFERVSQPRCFDGDGDVGGDVEIDGVNQEDVREGLVIFPKSCC